MNIFMRVDAGGIVGLGHFYRSLRLAQELQRRGHRVVMSHTKSSFWDKTKNSFDVPTIELPDGHEESATITAMHEMNADVLYVDGLIECSEAFISQIKKNSTVIFYQNVTKAKVYADVFIYPSLHPQDEFFDAFPGSTEVFKGLEYLLLGENVVQLGGKKVENHTGRWKIAIATGGSDPRNVLLRLHSIMDHTSNASVDFCYFYGVDFLNKASIPASVLPNVSFDEFSLSKIRECDVVIATFGMLVYECMYLGMPVLSVGHQIANAHVSKKIASTTQGIIDLGLVDDLTAQKLNSVVMEVIATPALMSILSRRAASVIDNNGINRVVSIIESSKKKIAL